MVGALDIVQLLRLQMQKQLATGENAAALPTAQLGLRFCRLMHDSTDSFHELSLAHACHDTWLKAILASVDARQWETSQLRALLALAEPTHESERLERAVKSEYALFVDGTEQRSTSSSPLLGRISFTPTGRGALGWMQ